MTRAAKLRKDGHEVLRLVRRKPTASSEIYWNPAAGELDFAQLAGANVIINLAGAGVGDSRWTDKYKAKILSSRVDSTSLLARAAAEVPSLTSQFVLSAATAAVCLAAVVLVQDRRAQLSDERNLADWERIVLVAQDAQDFDSI